MIKYLKYISIFILSCQLVSCSSDTQFTKKISAQPFVSQLHGEVQKTLTLSTEPGDHIAWIGLEWSADYKLFQIEKINEEIPETVSSQTVVENISVRQSDFDASEGRIIEGPLKITVTYRPSKAILSEDTPHKAYLLIAYEAPDAGIVRIELNGFTRGVKQTKCTGSPDDMEALTYQFVDAAFDFYLCDQDIVTGSLANDPDKRPFTNLTPVPVSAPFVLYKLDEETACILDNEPNNVSASIPDFVITIPEGVKDVPVDELSAKLPDNFAGECSLEAGALLCDSTLKVEVFGGAVPVSNLVMTTGKTLPTAVDCEGFGEISGAGKVGDSELTLIAWGEILANAQTTQFSADGALVVAVIRLKK